MSRGFFLQPATGFGERSFDEASWHRLLQLSRYPQVGLGAEHGEALTKIQSINAQATSQLIESQ